MRTALSEALAARKSTVTGSSARAAGERARTASPARRSWPAARTARSRRLPGAGAGGRPGRRAVRLMAAAPAR
jgi:hypothetical protein